MNTQHLSHCAIGLASLHSYSTYHHEFFVFFFIKATSHSSSQRRIQMVECELTKEWRRMTVQQWFRREMAKENGKIIRKQQQHQAELKWQTNCIRAFRRWNRQTIKHTHSHTKWSVTTTHHTIIICLKSTVGAA